MAESCFWTIVQQEEPDSLETLLQEHRTRLRGPPCVRKRSRPVAITSPLEHRQGTGRTGSSSSQKTLVHMGGRGDTRTRNPRPTLHSSEVILIPGRCHQTPGSPWERRMVLKHPPYMTIFHQGELPPQQRAGPHPKQGTEPGTTHPRPPWLCEPQCHSRGSQHSHVVALPEMCTASIQRCHQTARLPLSVMGGGEA